MPNAVGREKKKGQYFSLSPLELVILLFPIWLILFYFKAEISGWITSKILSLTEGSKASDVVIFFLTTTIKVFLLLLMVIFLAGLIRTWLNITKIRNKLNKLPPLLANLIAGLLGVISPFCSCSAIPVFISFLEAGIPLGITFSFLIASPLVNEIILIMLVSLFGWKIAIIYFSAGLLIAIVSGFVIDLMKLEKYLPLWLLDFRNQKNADNVYVSVDDRVRTSLIAVKEVITRTYLYIISGLMVGSIFHGYIPSDFLSNFIDRDNWFSIPLIVLAGIPLYSCSAAIAPIAFVLVSKGMPIGTALAFIMSVAGLSLPEFIMLRKVLSIRLLLSFITIVFLGIILTGYLFNLIL
jgi:uncharacterized membrane protein YraQ (UPF0718 family)